MRIGTSLWACSECGSAGDPSADQCGECGFKNRAPREIRPDGLSEEIYEAVHEGISQAGQSSPLFPGWYVYLMVNPETNYVFYVGMTMKPSKRLAAHLGDRSSAVFTWRQDRDVEPHMVVLAHFRTLEEARKAEEKLISFVPGLVNRDIEITRQRIRRVEGRHILARRHRPKSMMAGSFAMTPAEKQQAYRDRKKAAEPWKSARSNAPKLTPAEKQRAYRERQKAKS